MEDATGSASRGTSQESTGAQVTEKVQQGARQVTDQVQQSAQQAKSQAGDRIREQVNQRSTMAAEQTRSIADVMRRTGSGLREEGREGPANMAEQAADRAERLGSYLQDADADRILRDIEDFGRRRPWAIALGGAALGLVASRFLKASSSRRYQASGDYAYTGTYVSPAEAGYASPARTGYTSPAETGMVDDAGLMATATPAGAMPTGDSGREPWEDR